MKAPALMGVLLMACLLCGCESYRYQFHTVIFEDGIIERTICFEEEQSEPVQEDVTPVEGEDAPPENPPKLPSALVIPDADYFLEFEHAEGKLTGQWQSDGVIYADFRFAEKSYTKRGKPIGDLSALPKEPPYTREAYNEGLVTTTDLVFIQTYSYVERFNDYYTREEFDEYASIAIDRLADFILAVMKTDLEPEYDLDAFEHFVRETVVPFSKRRQQVLYSVVFVESGYDSTETPERLFGAPDWTVVAYDLMKLGVIDEPYVLPEQLLPTCEKWLTDRMHELITRREDGTGWPHESIEAYFEVSDSDSEASQPTFWATAEALSTQNTEDPELFGDQLYALYDSFASTVGVSHSFVVSVQAPGVFIDAVPTPEVCEPHDGTVTVGWSFDEEAFFPDGMQLTLVTAKPDINAQMMLGGSVPIEEAASLTRYINAIVPLPPEQRDAFLTALRECVEAGSIADLSDRTYAKLDMEHLGVIERLEELILFVTETFQLPSAGVEHRSQ